MEKRKCSFIIEKRKTLTFLTSLLIFLPSNIGSLQGLGSIIVMMNNIVIALVILNALYHLRDSSWKFRKFGYFCLLCVGFYVVRTVLVYLHGGHYDIHGWISTGKTIIAIMWFALSTNKSAVNRRFIMYAFWFWVTFDSLVTFIWPHGSPLFNGGYLLGWKNNKIEFLFIANLFGLIEIQSSNFSIKNIFVRKYLCFALMTLANAYVVDSGTSLLIILLLVTYLALVGKVTFIQKFPTAKFVLAFHILLWCAIIVNFTGKSLIGMLIERFSTRDATFTGRVYIWAAALRDISQAPISGYIDGFSSYGKRYITDGPLTGLAWEMAHNQVLELFMEGGVILFIIFACILLLCLYKNCQWTQSKQLARWALFCLMLSYLTEAFSNSVTFAILIAIYYTSDWCEQNNQERNEDIMRYIDL